MTLSVLELRSSVYLYATKSSPKDAQSLLSLAGDIRLNFLLSQRTVEKYLTSVSTTSSLATHLSSSPKKGSTQTFPANESYFTTQTENSSLTADTRSYITKKEYITRSIIERGQNDCSYSTGETILNASTSHQAHRNQRPPPEHRESLESNDLSQADREARHLNLLPSRPDHPHQYS